MKVYLATPYSHKDKAISAMRFRRINEVAAKLMKKGYIVYSPISATHPIAETGLLPDFADGTHMDNWRFWQRQDEPFIDWADELWVYTTYGWLDSVGVQGEIEMAAAKGKLVRFICPEDIDMVDSVR